MGFFTNYFVFFLIYIRVTSAVGPSVNSSTSSTDFSYQNLVFFGNLFEFSAAEIA
jgi:hypothetical protein